ADITSPCVPPPPKRDDGRRDVVTGMADELFSGREPGIAKGVPATTLLCAFLFLLVLTFDTTPTHLLTKLHFFKSVPKMLFPGTDSPSGLASSWFACSCSWNE